MASRSLGTLTIDLIAKLGGFTSGMTEAERVSDRKTRAIKKNLDSAAKEIKSTWDGIGKAIAAGFMGITIGSTINKIITETRNAEQEQALLAAALKATGNSAGYSQGRLNEMASAMEAVTTKSAGEFNQAQTVLLGFGNIVGEQLPKALMAAADYSIRTGADMKSAAEVMGRALDIPSAGMASLVKQGFKFTESQIEAAKKLEQTGKVAAAQQIVFDALNETYGGAATAARDTFGGAIDALRNTINGLLTGDSGSFSEARKSINDLNSLLSAPETKQAFETMIGWVAGLTKAVAQMSVEFVRGIEHSNGFIDALFKYGLSNPFKTPQEHIKSLQGDLKDAQTQAEKFNWMTADLTRNANAKQQQSLKQQIAYWQSTIYSSLEKPSPSSAPVAAPDMAVKNPGSINLKDLEGARQAAALAKQQETAAKQYLKTLTEQLDKTQHLTAYEKLMADVKRGTVVLSGDQLSKAQGLATVIDMTKEMERQRTENLARQNLLFETQERLMSRQQQYLLEMATYGMGDRAAAELRERIQLLQQHEAELRKIGADQANAIAKADDPKDVARIQAIYAERLTIIKSAQDQELSMFDDLQQQRRQKELDWVSGARSAFASYVESAQNLYQQTNQVVGNMLGGMENALVDFAMTGKANFKDFANSVIADLLRIQARQGIVGLFSGAGGLLPSVGKFLGFSDGGYTGPGGRMEPAGVVHRGEVVWSQRDVARAGGVGVVESMRRGLSGYASGGVVGLPKVVTSGAMASSPGGVTVNVPVSVTSAGGGGQASEAALAATGASLSKALTPMVREIIAREQRPGGRLWSWANGRG
ncbi:MAG: phage tail length tape measure family protein [Acidovorax sp.]|jgi:lambda family phage tail tape measure protein|nr:phage tail length tape measure family protein [Acidovorax sp.]